MKKFTSREIKDFVSKANFDEKTILGKDPSWPKISIVTPSYNQGRYLEQTILSVLSQQYPNLEYIIMDGGSKDNSVEIIKRYANQLDYWQSKPDGGQADAIAKGFAMSTGTILGWLNSDDLLLSGCLFTVAVNFPQDRKTVALAGRCILIGPSGEPLKVSLPILRTWTDMLFYGHGLIQMATFWMRTAYEQTGGLDISLQFGFDADLFVKLRRIGEIAITSDYLAAFRLHPSSKTSTMQNIYQIEKQLIRERFGKGYLPSISRMFQRIRFSQRIRDRLAWEKDKAQVRKILAFAKKAKKSYA
jgi:glycosyltransferase involved in cell wall biosynthesis